MLANANVVAPYLLAQILKEATLDRGVGSQKDYVLLNFKLFCGSNTTPSLWRRSYAILEQRS